MPPLPLIASQLARISTCTYTSDARVIYDTRVHDVTGETTAGKEKTERERERRKERERENEGE